MADRAESSALAQATVVEAARVSRPSDWEDAWWEGLLAGIDLHLPSDVPWNKFGTGVDNIQLQGDLYRGVAALELGSSRPRFETWSLDTA